MKRTFLFAALSAALLFAGSASAQVPVVSKVLPEIDLGVKVGANFQQLTGVYSDNAYKAGFVGGAFVGVRKNKLGVQAEVLVKTVKFSQNSSLGNGYINALYLDVPVLLEYKLFSRLWVQAGPQFSNMLSAKDNTGDKTVKNMFNANDFSGVLGLQVLLPMHFTAGARYILGFTDINNHSVSAATDTWNNRSIQVYVGFRFL